MKTTWKMAAVMVLAAETLAAGQGKDAAQVLAEARKALGGDKLAAVKTFTAEGRTLRTGPDGNTRENEFELALEVPDKYLMRSQMVSMGNMSIYRMTGFNGGQVIEEMDRPPNLAGGGNVVIRMGMPLGGTVDPEKMTPEQKAEMNQRMLVRNQQDFARMTLGMFAASLAAYPVEFTYAGEAEAADGKADAIDVKGAGDFAARLFIDQNTHLPLMITWMDKEPLAMAMVSGPGGAAGSGATFAVGGGGGAVTQWQSAGGAPPSREEMEKRIKEMEERRKEAEAKRRMVEYRLYYGDYQAVNGVMVPHRFQRSIDGKATEEMMLDTVKVNPKIDAKRFTPTK